jgi:cytochrome c553
VFHMNNNITAGLTLVVLFTTAVAFAQNDNAKTIQPRTGDPVAGKNKSQLCQGCHGEDGNSLATPIPKLAGQDAAYIAKQIHNFQTGTRKHRIMSDLATTVNDDDLIDIAAYFSSRNKMKGDGSAGNKIGKDLFLNGDASRKIIACVNCHGAAGKGLEPNTSTCPVIGGQHKDYLHRQLTNFRSGDRSNSPNGIMNGMTKSLTDAELESLAEYVSGQ